MKKSLSIALALLVFVVVSNSCKKAKPANLDLKEIESEKSFDSTSIGSFFSKHPKFKEFQPSVEKLYKKHNHHYLWYDRKGINEVGNLLYDKINNIDEEGVLTVVPYKKELSNAIDKAEATSKPDTQTELLISSFYFYYADKVFHGIDAEKSEQLGWYLPRKKLSYVNYLDSLLVRPSLINKDEKEVMGQYYRLKAVLQQYRDIEKKGGWSAVNADPQKKILKLGDSSQTIAQIRKRLVVTGDLKSNSKSALYDKTLEEGIVSFKKRMGDTPDKGITPTLIADLNVTVADRIRTIMVNMERCRWIPADLSKANEFIVINIPAYKLTYFKEGKPVLISDVVVGKELNKTVVFSGLMKYIVFSPYWNIPKSIVKKEIEPGIAKNSNYLAEHNMERFEGNIRQKPGPKNSLGLIKFLFPNSNNIYLHDTPAKELFNKNDRAFSHGCIRVQKNIELANLILKDDKNWNAKKIETAMHGGKEKWVTLQNKVPVYIGYFTAWIDTEGIVHFYDDVYNRDNRLMSLLYSK